MKPLTRPFLYQPMIMRIPFRYSVDSRFAFTLIELLVVIAIIALLAALAVPAVNGAMSSGQRTKCASNMKSIGAGIHLYAAENNGKLPGVNCLNPDATWIEQLQPYLGTNYTTHLPRRPARRRETPHRSRHQLPHERTRRGRLLL